MLNKIYRRNVLDVPWPMDNNSIDCCITSPPYWGLRDYGNADQIGLEKTPEEYVERMVHVFNEVYRVLKPEGTLWLNLGDSYASSGKNRTEKQASEKTTLNGSLTTQFQILKQQNKIINGLKPKDLVGIPWMVAFALRSAGWYLRQDIIWSKPNPMPESVTDRCTKSHEYIFLLTKSDKYYYNQEAIRVPLKDESIARLAQDIEQQKGSDRVPGKSNGPMKAVIKGHRVGGNGKYTESGDAKHRTKSGKDWAPIMAGSAQINNGRSGFYDNDVKSPVRPTANKKSVWTVSTKPFKEAHFATFPEDLITPCILAGCPKDGVVLDPFMGAGTTALVAKSNDRNFIGFELNQKYIEIAENRLKQKFGMFHKSIK